MADFIDEAEELPFESMCHVNHEGNIIIPIGRGKDGVFPYISLGVLEAKTLARLLDAAVLEVCDAAYGLKQKA